MSKEMRKYQEAVWQFIREHSRPDKDREGKPCLSIHFKTTGRQDFEDRIRGRWKYGYVRPGFEESKRTVKHIEKVYDRSGKKDLRVAHEKFDERAAMNELHEGAEETLGTL